VDHHWYRCFLAEAVAGANMLSKLITFLFYMSGTAAVLGNIAFFIKILFGNRD
jgi:hypothetical protein